MATTTVLDDLASLILAGYDVTLGTRKAPMTAGVYVALEHLDLDEPEEFHAVSLLDAIRQACLWSTTANIPNRNPDGD